MLQQLLCQQHQTIIEAIRIINENALGTVFVVDEQQKLLGILTDGDIRRLILDGIGLEAQVAAHTNTNFTYAHASEEIHEVLSKASQKVRIIPIVDEGFVVVDYFQYSNQLHLPVAAPNLEGNEFKYLVDAFLSTWISSAGDYIRRFEEDFSSYCECEYGVATSNGTTAIHLALLALGVGKGDEVIIPDFTFAATINAVLHAGATPVIVDINPDSWCIDVEEIKKAITPNTKAIIPVHIYGQPCDMEAIMAVAEAHHLWVVEDCAEAHGALYKGKKVGSFGHINCFSFFGNKVITTGEGGMCVTNDEKLRDTMKQYRDHGMSRNKKYWHDVVGYNYRMTNLQAAIGVAQLERIDQILANRKAIEEEYKQYFGHYPFIHFQRNDLPHRHKITWLVSATFSNNKRDTYLQLLKEKGIDSRPFFYPLSEMPLYQQFLFSNKNAKLIAARGINFPTVKPLESSAVEAMNEIFESS